MTLRHLLCLIGLHDYALVRKLSDVAMRVRCTRCERHFAVNMQLRAIIRWDAEAERFYAGRDARMRAHA